LLIISKNQVYRFHFVSSYLNSCFCSSFHIAYADPVMKGLHRKYGQYSSVRKLSVYERHILHFLDHEIFVDFIALGISRPLRSLFIQGPNLLKTKPRHCLCSCPILLSQPEVLSLYHSAVTSGKAISFVIHHCFFVC